MDLFRSTLMIYDSTYLNLTAIRLHFNHHIASFNTGNIKKMCVCVGAHPRCQSRGSWGPVPSPATWKPSPHSSDAHVP